MIMSYIQNIGWILLWSFPFIFVMNIVVNSLKIPLSSLGRIPIYILYTLSHYLFCLFYVMSVYAFSSYFDLSPVPFLVFTSFSIYTGIMSEARGADSENAVAFFSISSVVFVIVHILMYYNSFFFGMDVVISYYDIVSGVMNIPFLGDILNFILPAVALIALVAVAASFLIVFFGLISSFLPKNN